MWPFKKKRRVNNTIENFEEIVEKQEANTLDILGKFAEPFRIVEYRSNPVTFYIEVYNIEEADWECLDDCSEEIIGVGRREFIKLTKELFNTIYNDSYVLFKTEEDVQKAIEAFKPYYDSYHTPRAVAERLTFYKEDGFSPTHLLSHVGEIKNSYPVKVSQNNMEEDDEDDWFNL